MIATRRTVRASTSAQGQRRIVASATSPRPKRSRSAATASAIRAAAGLPPRTRARRALLTTAAEPVTLRRSSSPARSTPPVRTVGSPSTPRGPSASSPGFVGWPSILTWTVDWVHVSREGQVPALSDKLSHLKRDAKTTRDDSDLGVNRLASSLRVGSGACVCDSRLLRLGNLSLAGAGF
ncbi:hypothetical protein Emag_005338 [Eimeria magna]